LVKTAVTALRGLDCLVNNVGIGPLARIMDVTEAHWDEVIAVNLRSALFCTQAALPALRESHGSVVWSPLWRALVAGPTDSFVHAISKAGLVGMARTLALELAPENVESIACVPDTLTPSSRARKTRPLWTIDRSISKATPLGRMGTVRECASAILYFASNDATYCTGSTLVNDGGCHGARKVGEQRNRSTEASAGRISGHTVRLQRQACSRHGSTMGIGARSCRGVSQFRSDRCDQWPIRRFRLDGHHRIRRRQPTNLSSGDLSSVFEIERVLGKLITSWAVLISGE